MISERELETLLKDLESDRIERATSTRDTDKFCEAICAFANDMPGTGRPGYVVIGAIDADGTPVGTEVTDQLMQRLSNYADYGQIVPLPSLTVRKVSLAGHDLAVAEVRPSDLPPVRYRGRVWIRRGPCRAIASEQEERILTERRVHHARSFDLQPCRGCTLADLAPDLFLLTYRHRAVAPEIIEENDRELHQQMASLGFWYPTEHCPTNAGVLLFAADPCAWIPGAAIQYVRFEGRESNPTSWMNVASRATSSACSVSWTSSSRRFFLPGPRRCPRSGNRPSRRIRSLPFVSY